jgi:HlyD family secretion protein
VKKISVVTLVLACLGIAAGGYFASEGEPNRSAVHAHEPGGHRTEDERDAQAGRVKVENLKPHRGGIEHTTTQPGTVESFESARLFSKVSGYLKEQDVDIGAIVKKGDVLATIDMPEQEKEVERDEAVVEQAKAHVVQAEAHLKSAAADAQAAEALVGKREADVEQAEFTLGYRQKQHERIKRLVEEKCVEPKFLEEIEEHRDAARAGRSFAKASVVRAQAQATAAKAKIGEAQADVEDAKANVDVANAMLEKNRVFLEYTKIRSPYDGVITFRGFHRGDFINARNQGATTPLLSIGRTDKMRVVLQVPDLDVPFANKGDEATVEIDALPGREFKGTVARVSNSEDVQTRTMRTEVDLLNEENLLRDGMYGKVTIALERASGALSVP